MRYRQIRKMSNIIILGLLLFSCSSTHHSSSKRYVSKNDYFYNGINFGSNKDTSFKQGVQDGCTTTAGDYTKDSNRFKADQSYRVGWADGRLKCEQRVPKQ